jgi:hypothetical protein
MPALTQPALILSLMVDIAADNSSVLKDLRTGPQKGFSNGRIDMM